MATTVQAPLDESRLRRVLIATSLALFCIDLDFFALNLALPPIARDLGVTSTDLQWAVSAYMLALGSTLILAGRLGDIFGRRRVLVIGLVIFGLASLACGLAPSAPVLIAFRVLQGAAAALLFPVAVSVISNEFPADRVGRSIGVLYGVAAIGTALGPFVGGALTGMVGWRWVFWINVPFAVVTIALTLSSVRESRDVSAPRRLDVPGVVLLTAGIALISLAADRAPVWGWLTGRTVGTFTAGMALLIAFAAVETRVRWPLVDLSLFRNVPFDVVTAAGMLSNMAYVVTVFASTLYLQEARGLSPIVAGTLFLAPAIAAAAAGPAAGRLGALNRPALVMGGALTVGGIGLLVLSFASAWALYVPAFAVTGFGVGLGWAFASVGTQQVVDPARAGEASGVTLTVLITMGGLAVGAAATALEVLRRSGVDEGDSIQVLLRVVAAAMLVAAAGLLALQRWLGRAAP